MKRKKVIFIIIGILLICLISITIYCVFKKDIIVEKNIGITEIKKINNTDIDVYENFYLKFNDDELIMYSYDEYTLFQGYIDSYYVEQDYLIVYIDNMGYIYDKDGNFLFKGEYINFYDDYIMIDYDIYNYDYEKVYTIEELEDYDYVIDGNILISNSTKEIINLKTKEVIINDFGYAYNYYSNYIIIDNTDEYSYIYDISKDTLITDLIRKEYDLYTKYENADLVVYATSTNLYFSSNDYLINEYYKIDDKECEVGFNLVDIETNKKNAECLVDYIEYNKNVVLGINNDYDYVLYVNNEKINVYNYISKENNYFVAFDYDDDNIDVYNLYGEYIDFEGLYYDYLYYINDSYYIASYLDTYYLLNSDLKIVYSSNEYIQYNSLGFYTISADNNTTLMYNDKEIYTWQNVDIEIYDKYIVITSLWSDYTYVLTIGENDIITNLSLDNTNNYEDIDVDSVINEYGIMDVNDEELFQKYAYIVLNNDDLGDYKKYVLDIYQFIEEQKEYLNEYNFFSRLKELQIIDTDYIDGVSVGTYSNGTITIAEKTDQVIYHELMHFIDFEISNEANICLCDEEYYLCTNLTNNNKCVYDEFVTSNFIVESAAELYVAKYFTKEIDAYSNIIPFLELLEYIYGSDYIEELYFNPNSDYLFYKLLKNNGIIGSEYENIINSLNNITNIYLDYNDEDMSNIIDLGILLYINNVKEEWYNDKEFVYILNTLETNAYENSKYYDELLNVININFYNFMEDLFAQIDSDYDCSSLGNYLIIDNVSYLSIPATYNSDYGILLVEYDFENDKVMNYTFIK